MENDNLQALKKLKIDNKSSRMRHVKQHYFWSRRLGELGLRRDEIHVGTDDLVVDKMTKNYRKVKEFYRSMLEVLILLKDPTQEHFWKEITSGKIFPLPNEIVAVATKTTMTSTKVESRVCSSKEG